MVERVTALPKYIREHFIGEIYLRSKKSRSVPQELEERAMERWRTRRHEGCCAFGSEPQAVGDRLKS